MDIPTPDVSGDNFRCNYGIKGPLTVRSGHAMGVDAFQALQLALERIGTDLLFSEEGQRGELRWLDVPYDVGFPVPASIRDLATNGKE